MVNKLELFALTTLFLTPAFVILSKCAAIPDPELFAWHPAANAIAHLILSPAAIYIMIQRKSVSDVNLRTTMTKAHWLLQTLAFIVMASGGAAVYLTKEKNGSAHFTSTHSWLAGTFGTLWSLNLLGGTATTFISGKVDWKWRNPGHRVGGVLGFIGCGVTSVYGLYSGTWATKNLGADKQFKVGVLIAAAYFGLLLKAGLSLTKNAKTSTKKTA